MKTPIEALLVVAALFVQGCVLVAYVPGVEKTDLSAVYEETATRSEIEAVLGEPVASRTTDEGSISLYPYNRGAEGGFADQQDIADHPVVDHLVGKLLMLTTLGLLSPGVTPFLYADKFDSQKGFLAVFYSTDDEPTDIHLVGSVDPDTQMDRVVAWLELKRRAEDADAEAIVQIRKRAYEGDPEAMHSYAALLEDRSESWKWICRAANQNYPKSQGLVGHYYRQGLDPIKQNLLKAYVWYKLAESNGFQAGEVTSEYIITEAGPQCCKLIPFSETLANEMTPSEVAEAKRLVAEWKPNSAQCDEWTSPTAN
jgi:hypothetical protein